ncbi:hypothetical protein RhiirA1_481285 [Rhizophagus irregularis]|uniref:Replication origin-binding protein domain-containing protein n=1 Tax=Rhizophagus irregularis TaxID=588596 RepID=A0A2N0QN93_9GLOM|nr:hypothetical protein RhiirA1_481285 [Rhizophagus irregularis]
MMINVEKLKDAPEVYPDFLGIEKTTTLIRSPPGTWKTTALREIIMALKDKVESLFRIEFSVRLFVAILDEANAIMRQISSSTNARESENAMRDVLRSVRHILAMNAFANKSTLAFLKIYRGEGIYIIDNRYQPRGKRVAFISTRAVMAKALVEKASKLFKPDNSPVRAPYTNTVETGISFEVTGHFDIVIAITNIATPVHVEALAQMLY